MSEEKIAQLEAEVAELKAQMRELRREVNVTYRRRWNRIEEIGRLSEWEKQAGGSGLIDELLLYCSWYEGARQKQGA